VCVSHIKWREFFILSLVVVSNYYHPYTHTRVLFLFFFLLSCFVNLPSSHIIHSTITGKYIPCIIHMYTLSLSFVKYSPICDEGRRVENVNAPQYIIESVCVSQKSPIICVFYRKETLCKSAFSAFSIV